MNHLTPKDIQINNSLSESQINQLVDLYQGEWWTKNRNLADTRRMISGSSIIVAVSYNSDLVGFCRVITDYVYKAFILDVIVDTNYRDVGLGKVLLDHILNHKELSDVRHFHLHCKSELVPFYSKFGFEVQNDILIMQNGT